MDKVTDPAVFLRILVNDALDDIVNLRVFDKVRNPDIRIARFRKRDTASHLCVYPVQLRFTDAIRLILTYLTSECVRLTAVLKFVC